MSIKADFIWAIAANVTNAVLWATIIPISSHYLGVIDTAIWLNFVVLAGVAQLLELGFNPTLARNFSYVFAGAQSLRAVGLAGQNGVINHTLLAELICASQKVYILIGVLSVIVLWGGGSFYIAAVLPVGVKQESVLIDWCVYSLANIVALWFGYTNSMILGRGDVRFFNKLLVVTRCLQLVLSIIGLVAGCGLFWLGLIALISSITGRIIAYARVRQEILEAHRLAPSKVATNSLAKLLWHNSGRYGLVMIGTFLITRANLLIAGATIGIVPTAGYSFAIQVFTFLQSFAAIPFSMNLPKLNGWWAKKEYMQAKLIFGISLVSGFIIYLVGAIAFIGAGPLIINEINGSLVLPDFWILLVMALTFLLEFNHGACANFLTVANKVPFVGASIITGIGIVLASYIAAPLFGVVGLVAIVAIFQLLYNNWKWPLEASRLLGTTYFSLFSKSLNFLINRTVVLKR